jgi:hypothetical protein
MQIYVIRLRLPRHPQHFSVNTTEASGRKENFKCKFQRHLIRHALTHIDRSDAFTQQAAATWLHNWRWPTAIATQKVSAQEGKNACCSATAVVRTQPRMPVAQH